MNEEKVAAGKASASPSGGKRRFKKLDITALSHHDGGVCDVCGKPLEYGSSYVIDNYTFYHSPGYRRCCKKKNKAVAKLMTKAYFEDLYTRDQSEGSAVCGDCVRMFAAKPRKRINVKKLAVRSAAVLLALGVAAGAFLLLRSNISYFIADKKYSAGNYAGAYEGFSALGDFRDSRERAAGIFEDDFDLMTKLKYSEPGDVLKLSLTYTNYNWRIIAKKEGKVLAAQVLEHNGSYISLDELYDYVWHFDGDYAFKVYQCIPPELAEHITKEGVFIPTTEDYYFYVMGNDAFVPDDYPWLVKTSFDYIEDGRAYYNMSYVGTDKKLEGKNDKDRAYNRWFMWIDISD